MFLFDDTPRGAKRQKSSGALIFPAHPREKEHLRNQRELKKELDEVKDLKAELLQLKNELSKKD